MLVLILIILFPLIGKLISNLVLVLWWGLKKYLFRKHVCRRNKESLWKHILDLKFLSVNLLLGKYHHMKSWAVFSCVKHNFKLVIDLVLCVFFCGALEGCVGAIDNSSICQSSANTLQFLNHTREKINAGSHMRRLSYQLS